MRLSNTLALFVLLFVCGNSAEAQLKDMPSQAEFNPILENADKKLKDFASTLTQFRSEAASLDQERLDTDLKSVQTLREMIQVTSAPAEPTREGDGGKKGINMVRLVGILVGLDDMALDAATWKSLAELKMCQQLVQRQDPAHYDQFSTRVTMNVEMLREVSGQLFHPTFRAAAAADEIMLMLSDAASKTQPKPR
jgi:hypothetical protein